MYDDGILDVSFSPTSATDSLLFATSRTMAPNTDEKTIEPLPRRTTASQNGGTSGRRRTSWWRVQLFRGMINDLRRRAPFYASDWVDAWDYRVVPATVYMYFAKYVVFVFFLLVLHVLLVPGPSRA